MEYHKDDTHRCSETNASYFWFDERIELDFSSDEKRKIVDVARDNTFIRGCKNYRFACERMFRALPT